MAYATINKPNTQFNTVLWTGNGGTQTVTGVGFQPSLVWGKSRSVNYEQSWIDFVRGGTKYLFSNGTSAESTDANAITSFNADGFSISSSPYIGNANGATYVGWNWLASNSTVSNTAGTITSTVSANTTSGFSIVSYTGTGANATIGHGLGVKPAMMIIKNRISGAESWQVYHQAYGTGTQYFLLNGDNAVLTASTVFNNTAPTSSVFSVGTAGGTNGSSQGMIAYCFAEVKGFSKFGSYVGNGSTDGTFIYTGFKPAFVMAKASSTTGQWSICDTKRGVAPSGEFLFAESNETTNSASANWDFVSNGLKARANYAAHNSSGVTYIYMAFAENPLVGTNNIPATAR